MIATHDLLTGSPYQGYSYAYPHKTAYRPLAPAVPLAELWATERGRPSSFTSTFRSARCVAASATCLPRHAHARSSSLLTCRRCADRQFACARALGEHRFIRFAIGGGTPT